MTSQRFRRLQDRGDHRSDSADVRGSLGVALPSSPSEFEAGLRPRVASVCAYQNGHLPPIVYPPPRRLPKAAAIRCSRLSPVTVAPASPRSNDRHPRAQTGRTFSRPRSGPNQIAIDQSLGVWQGNENVPCESCSRLIAQSRSTVQVVVLSYSRYHGRVGCLVSLGAHGSDAIDT